MQCASCFADLDPNFYVKLCCCTLCHECYAFDLYTNGFLACVGCHKHIPFRTDLPMRVINGLQDLLAFMQLPAEELPLHNREIINGQPVDSIFVRLRQLKYDKRRVVVLNKRIATETKKNKELTDELASLQEAYDKLRKLIPVGESEPNSPVGSSDESSVEEQMWPDGKIRKLH